MKIYNEIIAQEKSHNSTYNLIDKQQLRQPSTYRGVKVRLLIFQIENLWKLEFLFIPWFCHAFWTLGRSSYVIAK